MFPGQRKVFQHTNLRRNRTTKIINFYILIVIILVIGLFLTALNFHELHNIRQEHHFNIKQRMSSLTFEAAKPIVWIREKPNTKSNGPEGYLKHIYHMFEKLGFQFGGQWSEWVVLWSHDYPFSSSQQDVLQNLSPFQKVNHFPGSGHITSKVNLAQTDLDFIPKAFEMPIRKRQFLEFASRYTNFSWIQKHSQHRGIEVKPFEKLELYKANIFIQEYISNPFLIDGRKFDIGIYTVLTSIDPLRVYFIDGEALFRFCPEVYYPFNSSNLDKYVIRNLYKPLWEMPSLSDLYVNHGYTFKNSFDQHLVNVGKDPNLIWEKIKSAIRDVILMKEPEIIKAVEKYNSKRNFFELVRFDFILDENLRIYMMEANMSPNLSSDHFPGNARLYEHVLFNLLGLVGIEYYTSEQNHLAHENTMYVTSQDTQVFPEYCQAEMCNANCQPLVCKLCKHCITGELQIDIKSAYLEHLHRGTARRIFPPSILPVDALSWKPDFPLPLGDKLNLKNRLMYIWFLGKCRLDPGWCH
ncbi:probable tubulin polyglutamylase ttll-15 [Physella acuta]|uniref:probable tubulin polyglutamylase ttll-15 n=1 Tax=Physella acuta TaxID=109671 RepID=UPI0027DCE385|nr:probable tubulin polyglutamylase ttll-15 [Physella acuta]XP_059149384.1 probable tubulin polyglutamylase ttll-15 [Physella acuta]